MTYSANDNQNIFVQGNKTTSRVLAQPGGACSISLGGWTAEELERQRQMREQKAAAVSKPVENNVNDVNVVDQTPNNENEKKQKAEVTEAPAKVSSEEEKQEAAPARESSSSDGAKHVSSNAFASSSTTNSFNVLTDRPTSRVTAPPGGHTSIRLW